MIDHYIKQQEMELEVLKTRLFNAMENLGPSTLKLLIRRFGLDGEEPISRQELADQLGTTSASVANLEAEALRALMGYGRYMRKANNNLEQ